jgi:hypothetical protein
LFSDPIPAGCSVCSWCRQVGARLFAPLTPSPGTSEAGDTPQPVPTGPRAFCSEQCFAQCRRASFKRNRVCDWCRHVRHTVSYVDFQDGESQLQFCR